MCAMAMNRGFSSRFACPSSLMPASTVEMGNLQNKECTKLQIAQCNCPLTGWPLLASEGLPPKVGIRGLA